MYIPQGKKFSQQFNFAVRQNYIFRGNLISWSIDFDKFRGSLISQKGPQIQDFPFVCGINFEKIPNNDIFTHFDKFRGQRISKKFAQT